jgi:competence protein ComEC
MDITTVYVGQGALAVIRHNGEAVVVDTHIPDAEKATMDRIRTLLRRLLKDHRLLGLVLTGFDADHAHEEGVDMVLTDFQPNWIMYPKYYKPTDTATAVFKVIDRHERTRKNTTRPLIRHSMRLDKVDSRVIQGLGAAFSFEVFSPHVEDMDKSNNCSIVLKVAGLGEGGFTYLVTGDTETTRWETIAKLFGDDLKSHVLAAPHHGSKTGVHAKSIKHIGPHTVLISAGVDNQYKHPDREAIDAFHRAGARVYTTHDHGKSLHTSLTRGMLSTTTIENG